MRKHVDMFGEVFGALKLWEQLLLVGLVIVASGMLLGCFIAYGAKSLVGLGDRSKHHA